MLPLCSQLSVLHPLLLWLQAEEASRRQGVCIGLAEVLENITRQQLQEHLSELLPAVQSALCDSDAGVRQVRTASVLPLTWSGAAGSLQAAGLVTTLTLLQCHFHWAGPDADVRIGLCKAWRLCAARSHVNGLTFFVQAAGGAVSILFRGSSGGAVDSVIPSLLQGLDGSAQQSAQVSSCCLFCWWPSASLCLTYAAAGGAGQSAGLEPQVSG